MTQRKTARVWEYHELEQLMAKSKPDEQLARELGVTVTYLRKKRYDMKHPRVYGKGGKEITKSQFDLVDTEEL